MNKIETTIPGVYILLNNFFSDARGSFSKQYNKAGFAKMHLPFSPEEIFYSVSRKDVIRGMHFQIPPMEHDKLVFVPYGSVLDVILDLRTDSSAYGNAISIELSSNNQKAVFIPVGCAHGFKSLTDGSVTVYMTSSVYSPPCDKTVRWNSFGFDWDLTAPILSDKDKFAMPFSEFLSPFRLQS